MAQATLGDFADIGGDDGGGSPRRHMVDIAVSDYGSDGSGVEVEAYIYTTGPLTEADGAELRRKFWQAVERAGNEGWFKNSEYPSGRGEIDNYRIESTEVAESEVMAPYNEAQASARLHSGYGQSYEIMTDNHKDSTDADEQL